MRPNTTPVVERPPRRKPLILHGTRLCVVAQGESLAVRREPAGVQRFPAARIDRVVCAVNVVWSGAAIALCLRRGITITWVDGRGGPIGDAVPRLVHPSSLDASLDRFLEMPRWAESYGNWRRRRRKWIMLQWAIARRDRGAPLTVGEWEARKREYVQNARVAAVYSPELFAWCRSVVVTSLGRAGLRTRYWAYDGQPLDLAEDMAELLWAEINFDHAVFGSGVNDTRTGAFVFESDATRRIDTLREHVAQLNAHVCRALEAWL
jgi:hypothetical protein